MLLLFSLPGACSTDPTTHPVEPCTATLPDSADCATAAPSYATDIAPLVKTHCSDCHFTGNRNSTVVLETGAQVQKNSRLVEAQLYRCAMPPADGTALTDDEREMFLKWIVCGAPDN